MNKFAKTLLLSLVIAAPVAISVSELQAEAAVSSTTPTVATDNTAHGTYQVAYRNRHPRPHPRRHPHPHPRRRHH